MNKISKYLSIWLDYLQDYLKEKNRRQVAKDARDWQNEMIFKIKEEFGIKSCNRGLQMTKELLDNPEVNAYQKEGNTFAKLVAFFTPEDKDIRQNTNISFNKQNFKFYTNEFFYYLVSLQINYGSAYEKLKRWYQAEKYYEKAVYVADQLHESNDVDLLKIKARSYLIYGKFIAINDTDLAISFQYRSQNVNQILFHQLSNEALAHYYIHSGGKKLMDSVIIFIQIFINLACCYENKDKILDALESSDMAKFFAESYLATENTMYAYALHFHRFMKSKYNKEKEEILELKNIIMGRIQRQEDVNYENEFGVNNDSLDEEIDQRVDMHMDEFSQKYSDMLNLNLGDASLVPVKRNLQNENFVMSKVFQNIPTSTHKGSDDTMYSKKRSCSGSLQKAGTLGFQRKMSQELVLSPSRQHHGKEYAKAQSTTIHSSCGPDRQFSSKRYNGAHNQPESDKLANTPVAITTPSNFHQKSDMQTISTDLNTLYRNEKLMSMSPIEANSRIEIGKIEDEKATGALGDTMNTKNIANGTTTIENTLTINNSSKVSKSPRGDLENLDKKLTYMKILEKTESDLDIDSIIMPVIDTDFDHIKEDFDKEMLPESLKEITVKDMIQVEDFDDPNDKDEFVIPRSKYLKNLSIRSQQSNQDQNINTNTTSKRQINGYKPVSTKIPKSVRITNHHSPSLRDKKARKKKVEQQQIFEQRFFVKDSLCEKTDCDKTELTIGKSTNVSIKQQESINMGKYANNFNPITVKGHKRAISHPVLPSEHLTNPECKQRPYHIDSVHLSVLSDMNKFLVNEDVDPWASQMKNYFNNKIMLLLDDKNNKDIHTNITGNCNHPKSEYGKPTLIKDTLNNKTITQFNNTTRIGKLTHSMSNKNIDLTNNNHILYEHQNSNQKRKSVNKWLSGAEIKNMDRSDANVVYVRKKLLDCQKSKAVLGLYDDIKLDEIENDHVQIKYLENKVKIDDMSKVDDEPIIYDDISLPNAGFRMSAQWAKASAQNYSAIDGKKSLAEIVMKHEDVFSLKKFIHERRKKQKQDQAANALERIGSFVDSVNIHNPAPTIPTKVNSRKTIALSPTKERVGECGGCTTDKKDILTNNEGNFFV